jgi:sugar lactone lactonase YvrE/enterochelin esterase-like enzyme
MALLLLVSQPCVCPLRAAGKEAAAGVVPKGTITAHEFDQSKIFPGTTRQYWVYVPQQYDAAKPACVYIGQDGLHPTFTETFDRLIASHQMPVTVGIFISPGSVPAPTKDAAPRLNRSFEYNSNGDDYARFLLEELLPTIVREQKLNLSTSGNDRSIGGCSSGASVAFTTAWEHPEAFRRVFGVSGAYPFARGSCYSVLVRKTEAKPLRIFLHAGKQDMMNASGDLWMDHEKLSEALAFAGYDCQSRASEGGHGDKYFTIFPEAMIWLWRDWPAPIQAGANPPRVQDILLNNEPWKLVGSLFRHVSGLAVNPQGEVFFCDTPANAMYKVSTEGKVASFLADAKHVSGLATGADGKLYGVSETSGDVVCFDGGGQVRTIAGGIPGHALVALRSGGFYVTQPGPQGAAQSKVWYVSPKGETKIVDTGLRGAAGVAISPDGWLLNVADSRSHWVYSYQINADGTLANREHFHWLHVPDTADDSGADGVAVARTGMLYVGTRIGIQVSDWSGHNQCILPVPGGRVGAIAFGGPGFDVLYAACGDKVYARKVKVQGSHAFQPPIKPTPGGL